MLKVDNYFFVISLFTSFFVHTADFSTNAGLERHVRFSDLPLDEGLEQTEFKIDESRLERNIVALESYLTTPEGQHSVEKLIIDYSILHELESQLYTMLIEENDCWNHFFQRSLDALWEHKWFARPLILLCEQQLGIARQLQEIAKKAQIILSSHVQNELSTLMTSSLRQKADHWLGQRAKIRGIVLAIYRCRSKENDTMDLPKEDTTSILTDEKFAIETIYKALKEQRGLTLLLDYSNAERSLSLQKTIATLRMFLR